MIAALSEMQGAARAARRWSTQSARSAAQIRSQRYISSTIRLRDDKSDLPTPSGPLHPSTDYSTDPSPSDPASEPEAQVSQPEATSSSAGPSRDMTLDAESSRNAKSGAGWQTADRASSGDGDTAEEDRQFAEIFNTLKKEWPKPLSPLSHQSSGAHPNSNPNSRTATNAESIGPKLTFHSYDTPSVRSPSLRGTKGVQGRQRRAAGQTPQEAAAFNRILADIFADLEAGSVSSPTSTSQSASSSGSSSSSTGFLSTPTDAYSATRGGPGSFGLLRHGPSAAATTAGAKARAQGLRRMFEREEDEADDEMVEELDMFKEEMAIIGTDIELLEWAKRRVFKPLSGVSSGTAESAGSSASASSIAGYTYPRSYPRILAHLLKTLRTNYNAPHLVLSVFEYAKTVSFESYLSGCLSGSYNEVLAVKWESFRDLEGVEQGVKEMEAMGVRWDAGTVRLVGKIVEEVGREVLALVENKGSAASSGSSSTSAGGRWGKEVFDRLARLDQRVQRDVNDQERYHERQQLEKRRAREERERKAEREMRAEQHAYA